MPKRWVDCSSISMKKLERKTRAGAQTAAEPAAVETEFAVSKQEEMLRELTLTEEPTEEAEALRDDLRRQVARAVAERD